MPIFVFPNGVLESIPLAALPPTQADLLALLSSFFASPPLTLALLRGGQPLPLSAGAVTLSLGLAEDDMIAVRDGASSSSSSASTSASTSAGGGGAPLGRLPIRALARGAGSLPPRVDPSTYGALELEDVGALASHPEQLRDALLHGGGRLLAALRRAGDAGLADAAEASAGVPGAAPLRLEVQRRLLQQAMPKVQRASHAAAMERRLAVDPMDVEAQRYLEEAIREKNVESNYELAHELMPESFARHSMLMVRLQVNGVPQLAMVDTGAQVTILGARAAAECGIMRFVDKSHATTMVGVGSSKSLGRVHMCELRVGDTRFSAGFNVMEKAEISFLLGLDFLQRFR
jgi:predicted aspartyl protease